VNDEEREDKGGDQSPDSERRLRIARVHVVPPPRSHLGPELASVGEEELHAACTKLLSSAIKARGSRVLGEELYWRVWHRVLGTRKFDPTLGKLEPWLITVAKSEAKDLRRAEAKARVRDEKTHARFQSDLPTHTVSAEQQLVTEEDAAERRSAAASRTDAIRALALGNPLALRVMDEWKKENLKPADIADALGVPVQQVYRAIESLRNYHANVVARDHKTPPKPKPRRSDE
jgi:DNA-directed RNA polymerase specialized sigma24 family protein